MAEIIESSNLNYLQDGSEIDESNRFWEKNLNVPVKPDYTLKEASSILWKKITLRTKGIWKFRKNGKNYVSYCALYQFYRQQQLYTKEN